MEGKGRAPSNVKRGIAAANAAKMVDCWTVTGKFIARFASGSIAAKALHLTLGEISQCCRGAKDVIGELFRFRFAGDIRGSELSHLQDELRVSGRASSRGVIRSDFEFDEEPPTKKSRSKTNAPHTTPSGSYGAKQSTYFVDAKEEAELRKKLRNVRPRCWSKAIFQPGEWEQEASRPFSILRWAPAKASESVPSPALAPLLPKPEDPFTAGFAGLQKKSWRESRGMAPKDSVTLQIVPFDTHVITSSEAVHFDAAAHLA